MALQIVSPLRALHTSEALVRRIVGIYRLLLMYRILTVCAALAALSLLLPRATHAQAVPVASHPQVVGVMQFMAAQPQDHSTWLYGGDASLEIKSNACWGIRGEISGQHWNSRATRYFGGLGPQVEFSRRAIVFHTDVLAGLSRDRPWVPATPPSQDGEFSGHQYNFAIRASAGVDARLSDRWRLRMAEVSFTQSFANPDIQNVDYSAGVAYVF